MRSVKRGLGRNRKLGIESLENRWTLDGNLSATLANGVLTIVGDDLDNIAAITSDSSGQITITGTDTTMNEGTDPVSFTGVNSVVVRLNGGNDQLTIVNGGGTEEPTIAAIAPVDIVRNLSISGGDGDDTITVSANVGGNLGINGGAGIDTIDVTDSSVARCFGVAGAGGDDSITIANLTVSLTFGVDGGAGTDTIAVNSVQVAKEGGIGGGSGDDTITVTDSSFRNLGVSGWWGNDTISLTGITARNVGIDSGAGDDTVTLDDVVVTDTLFAQLGDGNDSLAVKNSSARLAWFLGWRGTDTLSNDASNTFTRTRTSGF